MNETKRQKQILDQTTHCAKINRPPGWFWVDVLSKNLDFTKPWPYQPQV